MDYFILKLFIAGPSAISDQARQNLDDICTRHFADRCKVTIVDVVADPEQAETNRVLATPTLVKESPLPVRRIIGDLSNTQIVLNALGVLLPVASSGGES